MGLNPDDATSLGRGPVEAAGVGLSLDPGDVALRCNLATLEKRGRDLVILDRRAGRPTTDTQVLCESLQHVALAEGVTATLRAATQHRAVLRLSGVRLSPSVGNTDPGDAAQVPTRLWRCRPASPSDPWAARTAAAINQFIDVAFESMVAHPANRQREQRGEPPITGVITRGAGALVPMRNTVRDRRLRTAVVAAECTVLGLGRLFDFTLVTDPRFTALTDTDLDAKIEAARSALETHDLVFVHIKGADVCSHDQKPRDKRDFLEQVDAALAPLLERDCVVAVSADHTTDSNTGAHTGDPVPSLIYVPGGEPDGVQDFGETACRDGGLGRLLATSFLDAVFQAMETAPGAAQEPVAGAQRSSGADAS
jgi:2,3-bisphosphoglycerate-independent phosphoglycerate mutase